MLKIYTYKGCSTCKSATRWLKEHGVPFDEHAIRETPPSVAELKAMKQARGGWRFLFNTSGQDYRALGLKDKIADLTDEEATSLLSQNGNLVKRPFALQEDRQVHLVGFKEDEWQKTLVRAK